MGWKDCKPNLWWNPSRIVLDEQDSARQHRENAFISIAGETLAESLCSASDGTYSAIMKSLLASPSPVPDSRGLAMQIWV
jgi:hypothetical protein